MADQLTIAELVTATPLRQLYRARKGTQSWAVVVLPTAGASPPGWADRLRDMCARGVRLQNPNLALFTEVGAVSGLAALGRPWVDGTSARTFGRGKVDGLPPLLALLGLVDLALSLEGLHAAGVFHGSIGPETAIVDPAGHLALVDAGVGPAISGKAGSEAADVRALGKLAYYWLTSREVELTSDELPVDLGLPSRLDRRVPAAVDPLMLRTLQAGRPRGLKHAKELVVGLRQVLRTAGAAVSSADVAQWVAKSEQSARVQPSGPALLSPGPVQWEPLVERQIGVKAVIGQPGPRASALAATLVDMPAVRGGETPALQPLADPSLEQSQASSVSGVSSSTSVSVSVMRPRRIRRWTGALTTAALIVGVVVLGYALKDNAGKGQGKAATDAGLVATPAPRTPAIGLPSLPTLAANPPAPSGATGASGSGKPLAAYHPPPLPEYDPNAPPKPKPPPKAERTQPHLGHGAWLSVEASRVARVFVDGQDLQLLTPVKHFPIAPGTHRIRLVAAMGAEGSQEFEVKAKRGKTAYRFGKLDE